MILPSAARRDQLANQIALVLGQLVRSQPRGLSGSFLARLEGRHCAVGGNALRAAVLGANDGLCSNLSLVMGVAGALIDNHGILMTGIAGLLGGACSMALGEWVSVTSSRELAQRKIRIESSELTEDPQGEGEELRLIYEAKGLSGEEAKRVVAQILQNKEATLDALSREELGIDPTELGGPPVTHLQGFVTPDEVFGSHNGRTTPLCWLDVRSDLSRDEARPRCGHRQERPGEVRSVTEPSEGGSGDGKN